MTVPTVTVRVVKTTLWPALVRVPLTVKRRAQTVVFAVAVPDPTNVSNPLPLFLSAMVLLSPFIVTVLVPAVNVVKASLVSQFPATDQAPVVRVRMPLAVAVTFVNVTVEALAVRVPETDRFAPPEIVLSPVVRVPDTERAEDT